MDEAEAAQQAERALGLSNVVPLARGGQKSVCRARRGSEEVVLKIVMLTTATDPNSLERCEREVALLKDLNSPHIVRVLSDLLTLGSGPDAAVWVEEFLDGSDFRTLTGAPWTWRDVEDLLSGVGRGLAVMHGHNYIHRDLSPGNVRRTSRGTWVVMDPGFAKHLKRTSITGLFQPGTPGHMSPEHAAIGGRVTRASDVYCLGILAFQALTGNLPIPVGTDLTDYRRRLLAAQPETLGTLRPDLTSEQAHLVDTCLQRQPARRYLDGGELIDALQAIPGGPPR